MYNVLLTKNLRALIKNILCQIKLNLLYLTLLYLTLLFYALFYNEIKNYEMFQSFTENIFYKMNNIKE